MRVKLAIIGAGMAWDKLHWPALQRLPDRYEITGVADKNIQKARDACDKIGLPKDKAFNSYQKMLNTIEADAIDILVPIDRLHEVTKDVVAHGKHLIMEKPVATTMSQAKDIVKLSKKVKLMVAENFRYEEENSIIKNLIDDKAIGNVVYFIDNNIIEFQADMAKDKFAAMEWRQHPDFRGGIFLDSGVHHIARQRFLFGNVKNVYAQGRGARIDWCPYSSVNAMLRFGGDVTGMYSFFCIGRETQSPLVGLRIFGTSGEIYLESKECGFVNFTTKDGERQAIPYTPNSGYTNELINFHEAITNGMEIISTPEKGIGDVAVIFDILNSIESGEVIEATAQLKKKVARNK